jgi:hypothetical protein
MTYSRTLGPTSRRVHSSRGSLNGSQLVSFRTISRTY